MSLYSVKFYMSYEIHAKNEDEAVQEAKSLLREEYVGLSNEDMDCLGHEIRKE